MKQAGATALLSLQSAGSEKNMEYHEFGDFGFMHRIGKVSPNKRN